MSIQGLAAFGLGLAGGYQQQTEKNKQEAEKKKLETERLEDKQYQRGREKVQDDRAAAQEGRAIETFGMQKRASQITLDDAERAKFINDGLGQAYLRYQTGDNSGMFSVFEAIGNKIDPTVQMKFDRDEQGNIVVDPETGAATGQRFTADGTPIGQKMSVKPDQAHQTLYAATDPKAFMEKQAAAAAEIAKAKRDRENKIFEAQIGVQAHSEKQRISYGYDRAGRHENYLYARAGRQESAALQAGQSDIEFQRRVFLKGMNGDGDGEGGSSSSRGKGNQRLVSVFGGGVKPPADTVMSNGSRQQRANAVLQFGDDVAAAITKNNKVVLSDLTEQFKGLTAPPTAAKTNAVLGRASQSLVRMAQQRDPKKQQQFFEEALTHVEQGLLNADSSLSPNEKKLMAQHVVSRMLGSSSSREIINLVYGADSQVAEMTAPPPKRPVTGVKPAPATQKPAANTGLYPDTANLTDAQRAAVTKNMFTIGSDQ